MGGGIQEPPRVLRIEALDQLFGKQDDHLLALAFEGGAGGEDLLGEVRRRVGERCFCSVSGGRYGWQWGSGCAAQPDQASAPLVGREALGLNELDLQVFAVVVIRVKPPLRGAVGDLSLGGGRSLVPGARQTPPSVLRLPLETLRELIGGGSSAIMTAIGCRHGLCVKNGKKARPRKSSPYKRQKVISSD